MQTVMTVTDLVRDTCKKAATLVERGNDITVTSGKKILFRIVPNARPEVKMTAKQYKAFVKDLEDIAAKANPDKNPIIKLRQERS
jgi:antitoxin (DNA-binding transcriptional repressor) of toxin-antitoxin stability system